jgi:hypothetical protein
MFSVPERVQDRSDPFATLLDERPDVMAALPKLERMLKG